MQTELWDPAGRLQEQLLGRSDDKTTLLKRTYQYDAASQLTDIHDSRRGPLSYRYDPVGRLLNATSRLGVETFAFDPANNLFDEQNQQVQRPLEQNPKRNKLMDNLLREYAGSHYDYDERGNQIRRWHNGQQSRLHWDLFDRLVRFENSQLSVDYAYDPLGRRLYKHSNAHHLNRSEAGSQWNRNEQARKQRELGCGFTLFGWDGDTLAWESSPAQADGANGKTVHYLYEPGTFVPVAQALRHQPMRLLAQPSYTGAYDIDQDPLWTHTPQALPIDVLAWYQCDHLGTPQELTDPTGQIVWSAQYKAWGKVTEQRTEWAQQKGLTNPIRFQGQYHDHETGLHYNRYRYYDPRVGRFVSKDPISYAGGLNLYAYAPNPVEWVDPLGLAGHKIKSNTAGSDVLSRGVHVNVNGSGLPTKGGHISLKPNDASTHIVLVPADKATRDMSTSQWGKACSCVENYLETPGNVDRLAKSAQAGADSHPRSDRVGELKEIGDILRQHLAAGTNPVKGKR